jgi:cobalt-zinc-cadmium efflux system membrane fusion protein
VFENDLGDVHLGDIADIRLNAYPDRKLQGTVTNISRVLDPNTRSAKVRIVMANTDGSLRPGMFAEATFRSRRLLLSLIVPATAVMRLHDRDWVFRHEGQKQFRRTEVRAGDATSEGFIEIREGLHEGDPVVANALDFSTAVTEEGK